MWFRRTQRRLDAGRERAASRALGIMSHFIADVANPMHTDQSNKEEDIHSPYEDDVDEGIRDYPFRYDGRGPARPGPRTRRVARIAQFVLGSRQCVRHPHLQPEGSSDNEAPAGACRERAGGFDDRVVRDSRCGSASGAIRHL